MWPQGPLLAGWAWSLACSPTWAADSIRCRVFGAGMQAARRGSSAAQQLLADRPAVVLGQRGKGVRRLVVKVLARPAGEQVVGGAPDGVLRGCRGWVGGFRCGDWVGGWAPKENWWDLGPAGGRPCALHTLRQARAFCAPPAGPYVAPTLLGPHGRMPVRYAYASSSCSRREGRACANELPLPEAPPWDQPFTAPL